MLRETQAARLEREHRDLKDAAALLELHKQREIPWQPVDHGFVFLKCDVERFADRLKLLNQARHIEHVLFHMRPAIQPDASPATRNFFVATPAPLAP